MEETQDMTDAEPEFPPFLAVWDPAQFPDRADWHAARFHFAPQRGREELRAIAWLSRANTGSDPTTNKENN
jgi:hypothetical protein